MVKFKMDITQILTVGAAAIIAALSSLITGIIATRANAHKLHAEARAVESETESKDKAAAIAELERAIEQQGRVIERLEVRYKTLFEQSKSDWQDLNSRIEKVEAERDALIEAARVSNNKMESLQRRVTELEAELARKNSEIERKNCDIDAKNKELAEKNQVIEDYQRRLSLAIAEVDRARKDTGKL